MPPLILVKQRPVGELLLPKSVFQMQGKCDNCGRQFFVRIRNLTQIEAKSAEDAENKEKALSDWLQVQRKHLCVDCWPKRFRNFIAIHGNIVYR